MIPPVVEPGDVLQRLRMPNAAGVVGKSMRVVSVSGDTAQIEWVDAVYTSGTYANPAWITELASTKITGTLTKAQQHAQTPYKDEANTWAQSQTMQAGVLSGAADLVLSAGTAWNDGRRVLLQNHNTVMASFQSSGIEFTLPSKFNDALDVTGQVEIYGTGAANKFIIYNNATKDYNRFSVNSDTGTAMFTGPSGNIGIYPSGGATQIIGDNLHLRSVYTDLTFVTNSATTADTPIVLRNGSALFNPNVWHKDLYDVNRFYFAASSTTFLQGHGATPFSFRNGSGTDIVSIASDGATTFQGAVTSNKTGKLGDYTVATLPSAASNTGHECNVTDSSVTTFGSTVAGGGSNNVKVRSNGTNWTVTGI